MLLDIPRVSSLVKINKKEKKVFKKECKDYIDIAALEL